MINIMWYKFLASGKFLVSGKFLSSGKLLLIQRNLENIK